MPLIDRAFAIEKNGAAKSDFPDLPYDLNHLAIVLKATNRPAEAESLMRRFCQKNPAHLWGGAGLQSNNSKNRSNVVHYSHLYIEAQEVFLDDIERCERKQAQYLETVGADNVHFSASTAEKT